MLTKEEVRKIAHLSRINLTEEEVERFTKDLEKILHYIEKLKALNLDDIQPTSHVLPLKNVFRKDLIKPCLEQGTVMHMARFTHKGSFKVPQVIE